jgi:hypothetical protein
MSGIRLRPRTAAAALLAALLAAWLAWRLQVFILGRTHDGGPAPVVTVAAAAVHAAAEV